MRYLSIMVMAGVLLGSTTASQAAFSDDFSASQASSTNDGSAGFDTGSTLMNGTFGTTSGNRLLQTDIVSNTAPGDARGRSAITTGSGTLTYSSDDEVTAFGYVTYSFASPISLTLAPAFQFTFLSNDAAGSFTVGLTDTNGVSTTATYTLPVVIAGAPLVLTVPANVLGVNTASVSKLVFSFGGTKSEDLSVGSISAVPEPGSLGAALVLGGLAGAGWLARRRRA